MFVVPNEGRDWTYSGSMDCEKPSSYTDWYFWMDWHMETTGYRLDALMIPAA